MQASAPSSPPLSGIRVIEFAGLGPAPYACMLLADLGADVLRIGRPDAAELFPVANAPVDRGRRLLHLDLKKAEAIDLSLRLIGKADVLIEGYRPGVMERLGLGPDAALAKNPKLIYGRMTGWGQEGPLANAAGHDLTFLALTGALEAIGPEDGPPVPPLNLIGDMGGGGVFLVIGILSALVERQRSGLGQVIDAAILDGVASQLALILGLRPAACGVAPGDRIFSMAGCPSTGPIAASMENMWRWARLKRNSSRRSWRGWGSTRPRSCPRNGTGRVGRHCGASSKRSSRPSRETHGPRSLRKPMPASLPS